MGCPDRQGLRALCITSGASWAVLGVCHRAPVHPQAQTVRHWIAKPVWGDAQGTVHLADPTAATRDAAETVALAERRRRRRGRQVAAYADPTSRTAELAGLGPAVHACRPVVTASRG